MEELSIEECLKLMAGSKKPRKRLTAVMSGAEEKAGEYLTISRSCQATPKIGGSCLLYEPFTVRMGSVTYKPDWVVSWSPFERECFEVKEVRGRAWKGWRDREARVKLELLKTLSEQFGWRCFLLLVEGNKVTEKEI